MLQTKSDRLKNRLVYNFAIAIRRIVKGKTKTMSPKNKMRLENVLRLMDNDLPAIELTSMCLTADARRNNINYIGILETFFLIERTIPAICRDRIVVELKKITLDEVIDPALLDDWSKQIRDEAFIKVKSLNV